MPLTSSNLIFFTNIIIIGLVTSLTDIRYKKIYNLHLIISAAVGLLTIIYALGIDHQDVLTHLIDGLMAFLIGFLMHRANLWRGGDAKLFALLAFLMPKPYFMYSHALFPGAVSLFACSFIAGTLILIPIFIKDIITHAPEIIHDPLLPARLGAIRAACGTVLLSSWLLSPFYSLSRIADPFIIMIISYLFFSWGYAFKPDVKKEAQANIKKIVFIIIFIIIGFLLRLWLVPQSLSWAPLSGYLIKIILTAFVSGCIYTTFHHFEQYEQRVSFAPLLLLGCILSYTPFLTLLIQALNHWNRIR